MSKGDIAKELFLSGYNCSQSVVLAFKDEIDLSEEQIKKLSIVFGGGLGRQRLTCGAVSGMAMVISYLKSDGIDKHAVYDLITKACNDFKAEVGSLICGELLQGIETSEGTKPEPRTEKYYKKRPCADICKLAGDIAEKYVK